MIQIVLLILKIIGITLLALLGLVLLAVALVLFVPICYRGRVIWEPEQREVMGRVSFLFPLIFVRFGWCDKLWYKGRVFGYAFLDSEKPKEEQPKEEKTKKEKSKKSTEPEVTELKRIEVKEMPLEKAVSETNEVPETEKITLIGEKTETRTEDQTSEDSPQEEKSEQGFFTRLWLKWEKIRDTIGNLIDKLQRVLRQKEELQRILEAPRTKRVVAFVWDKGKKLFKHILPRKIKGYVKYGSDDPATTGKVLGIISVLYAKTGPVVRIVPNFEEAQLECDVEFVGRIQIFTLILIAAKLFLNGEIKQVIQEFKNIKDIE